VQGLTREQTIIAVSVGIAAILACMLLFRSCLGGGIGEPCGPSGACRLGLNCVANKCLPRCGFDDDCPSNMRCGIMELPGTQFTDVTGPMLVCLPKEDAERQVQRSVAAGDNRLTALNRKRSETYDAVQTLLAKEQWVLTDDAFDKAWHKLPEDVRRERPSDTLARLIMTTAGSPK